MTLDVQIKEDSLLVDVSTGRKYHVVPRALHLRVLFAIQAGHHPGVRTMQRLLKALFIWPWMAVDAAAFMRNCGACQK